MPHLRAAHVSDERWGEGVATIVVMRDGCAPDADVVVPACQERRANYKKPRTVEFVDELPKTGSDKIMRSVLYARFWRGQERSAG